METMLKGGLCLFFFVSLANCLTYTVDSKNGPSSTVNENFLSVTIDSGHLSTINLAHPNFAKLTKYLSPMYLRLGGTTADALVFEDDTKAEIRDSKYGVSTFKASRWLEFAEFSKNANVRILFDLNSLLRNDDGSWNSENAEIMIKFSQENGIDLDWELGNEPDLYQALFNTYVTSTQLGNDIKTLRALLDKYEPYNSSLLVGPSMFDVGSSSDTQSYLKNYLGVASSTIDAVTWHHYYFNGKDGTQEIFLDPATFNYFEQRVKVVTSIVASSNKVWLDETSSAYNQGAQNMTDKFIASFLWLDKLGLGAQLGMDVITRQTIWGYNYPLLNVDFNPNPDWWVSLLYKNIVGTKVLTVTNDGEDTRPVRLYSHCARQNDLWDDSAVVVFGVNINDSAQTFGLAGLKADSKAFLYEITAESSLYDTSVRLNGEVLNLTEDLELPNLEPKVVDLSDTYTISPYSLVFLVFSNTNVQACQ